MEQRVFAAIHFQFTDLSRHHQFEELFRPFVRRLAINMNRIDVGCHDIANRPNDHVAFFVDIDRSAFLADPVGQSLSINATDRRDRATVHGGFALPRRFAQ